MKITTHQAIATMAILLTTIILTSGCSGSREDVRVTFCKDLTSALVDSSQTLVWKGNENTFKRPEYVAVNVLFELPDESTGDAVCFYGYDTADENAMTHSQPFSAYSTLPYDIVLNGEPVAKSLINDAIKSQQQQIFKQAVNTLNDTFEEFSNRVERN